MGYSIRTDRYRFTQWLKWIDGMERPSRNEVLAEELYDVVSDPEERMNLAQDPSKMDIKAKHQAILSERLISIWGEAIQ